MLPTFSFVRLEKTFHIAKGEGIKISFLDKIPQSA